MKEPCLATPGTDS